MVLRVGRIAVASIAVGVLFGAAFALDPEAALGLGPALLIALPLLAGRYLGERRIARLAARRRPAPRHAAREPRPAPVLHSGDQTQIPCRKL